MAPVLICFLMTIYLSTVSAQTFSFRQRATGPSSVCEGSDVTLQCVIVTTNPDNTVTVQPTVWTRNGMPVQVTNTSGRFLLPNHNITFNFTTGGFTVLVITNVTLDDNNTAYTCAATGAVITSSVVLNVTGIPPVDNLTVADNCTSVAVSWDITDEGSCKGLSYNVSLTSLDDDVILQSVITNDTSHTFTGAETSNEMFSVHVNAFNENARGPSHTTTAVVRVSPNDLPSPVNLRTVSTICVTFFNISWDASNRITCGDVFYDVLVFPSPIEPSMEQITGVDTFYFSVTGLNNSDPNVTITVTASNRAGQGNMSIPVCLPESLDPPPINDVTVSTFTTPSNLSGFDIFILWTRPVINDSCTTLPVTIYTINASVTFMNGNEELYISNIIMDTSGDSMGRFNVSYNRYFNETLVPNAEYNFAVNSDNPQLPPSPSPTPMTGSGGEAVIIIIVICLIIAGTLFIIAGIAAAYLYMKHKAKGDDNKTKLFILVLALFLISFGVGLIILAIWIILAKWLCKNRKDSDVQPNKLEMTGDNPSVAVYASTTTTNKTQEDTDGSKTAQEQALYSYARAGPINVVVPGGKP